LLGKNGILPDLFEEGMFLLLQAVQLFLVFHPVQNTAAVEKHHPYAEDNQRNRVFVEYYFKNLYKHDDQLSMNKLFLKVIVNLKL